MSTGNEAGRSLYTNSYYQQHVDGSVKSASACFEALFEVYRPQSVVDIGCGLGGWLKTCKHMGVDRVFGVDGSDISAENLLIDPSEFRCSDLTKPIDLSERFDLAMSMEVAEHLDASHAPGFVALLTSLAPVVMFSAAIPNQGGTYHVNEQWPMYWARLFREQGYGWIDPIRDSVWEAEGVEPWYAQNTLVFAHRDSVDLLNLKDSMQVEFERDPRSLVHPGTLEMRVGQMERLETKLDRAKPWRLVKKMLKD